MGHAAGQLADGFQPLRLLELLLQRQMFGDVGVDGQDGVRLAEVVGDQAPARV